MGRLENKVAIITGSNSGVGAAAAKLFAKEGAKVVISARRLPQLEEVAAEIRAAGGEVLVVQTDVSKVEDCENLVAKTVEAFGKVDILVNNAGVLEAGLKPIDVYSDEDVEWVYNINTKGTMYCTRAVLKNMIPNNSGSIINLDSVAGAFGCGGAAYVSSKAAIIGLTKHTAMRFTGTGIRCNSVNPSTIITPMTIPIIRGIPKPLWELLSVATFMMSFKPLSIVSLLRLSTTIILSDKSGCSFKKSLAMSWYATTNIRLFVLFILCSRICFTSSADENLYTLMFFPFASAISFTS